MINEPYETLLHEYLKGEYRVLNAHIPSEPKTLAALLHEDYPGVACKDGSAYLIKRKELQFLAGFLDAPEQAELLLPMLIEVIPGQDEIAVISRGKLEEKVISHILGMPVLNNKGRIKLYRTQLALIRKDLRTATQYIFSPKLPYEM